MEDKIAQNGDLRVILQIHYILQSLTISHYDITPALQPYVKLICTMDCDTEADTSFIHVLPDACVELFINYTSTPIAIIDEELHKHSIINSRMSRGMAVKMRKGAGCLAICFYPGMAHHFFRVSMHVLSNTTIALSELWQGTAKEIEDKLAGAGDNKTRVAIAQQYLLHQLTRSKQDVHMTDCLRLIHCSDNIPSVATLTGHSGFSQRQLSRQFQQYVGLSTKEYLSVCRFIRSLDYLRNYPAVSLTEVAYESGYFDQSHFIRDYKTYAGHTPREVASLDYILF